MTTTSLKVALETSIATHGPEGLRALKSLWPIIERELGTYREDMGLAKQGEAEAWSLTNKELRQKAVEAVRGSRVLVGSTWGAIRAVEAIAPIFEAVIAEKGAKLLEAIESDAEWFDQAQRYEEQLEATLGHLEATLAALIVLFKEQHPDMGDLRTWNSIRLTIGGAENHLKAMRES